MVPLSLAVAGPVADVVGIQVWYVVGGVTFALMGVGAFFVPVIVNLEQNHNGHAEKHEPQLAVDKGVAIAAD
jgi:hypothetical protein